MLPRESTVPRRWLRKASDSANLGRMLEPDGAGAGVGAGDVGVGAGTPVGEGGVAPDPPGGGGFEAVVTLSVAPFTVHVALWATTLK